MSQLRVEIRLESPRGETIGEISSLRQDIEAELRAVADEEGVDFAGPQETKPPPGAQGLAEALQWIVNFSTNNPQELLPPVLHALREIISHYRSRNDEQNNVTINVVIADRTIDLTEKNLALREEIEEAVEKRSRTDT